MARRPEQLEKLILHLLNMKEVSSKSLFKLLFYAFEKNLNLVDLMNDQESLSSFSAILSILDDQRSLHQSKIDSIYNTLLENEIAILWFGHDLYPKKLYQDLRFSAPPVLFIKGNVNLLSKKGMGICGSRNTSKLGLELASRLCTVVASNNIVVVSGNARGVDEVSHMAALKVGGSSIYVLPEGILRAGLRNAHEVESLTSNYLIVSEFFPLAVWSVSQAMKRNKTISALSECMVVVEAGETGGTFNSGVDALAMGKKLFLIDGGYPDKVSGGTQYFERQGISYLQTESRDVIDVSEVISWTKRSSPSPSLFD